MKKYALYVVVYIFIIGTLHVGHAFFSTEVITPTNQVTQLIRDSHYSWSFFVYEIEQTLMPIITFVFLYMLFSSLHDKPQNNVFKPLKNVCFLLCLYHVYKLRVVLKLDPELEMGSFFVVENYLVTIAFMVLALFIFKTHALSLVGFDSIGDLLSTVFAYKHKMYGIYLFAPVAGGILAAFERNVDAYIYSPAFGVYLLWIAALLDIILGVTKAINNKEFSSHKLRRGGVNVVVSTIIIGIVNGAVDTYALLGNWMIDSIMVLFTFSFLISSAKNAYLLGFINKDVYQGFEKLINLKNVFKKK